MKSLILKYYYAIIISGALLFTGCAKDVAIISTPANPSYTVDPPPVMNTDSSSPTGLKVHLTSNCGLYEMNALHVDISSIEYNTSPEQDITTGWERIELNMLASIDLLQLVNGNNIRLNQFESVPLNIRQLRLRFGADNYAVLNDETVNVVLTDSLTTFGATVFTDIFVMPDQLSDIWINFDAGKSISYDTTLGSYVLTPVVSSFNPHEYGSVEGFATPVDANAAVYIYPDAQSRTALAQSSIIADKQQAGYFKFVALPEGIYQVETVAGDGSNRRKLISNVEVKKGENTNIGEQLVE
jgi:hypothetical protein